MRASLAAGQTPSSPVLDAVPRFTSHRFIARPVYRAIFLAVPEQEQITKLDCVAGYPCKNKGSATDVRDIFEKNLCRWCASARRKPLRNEKNFRGNSSGMWPSPDRSILYGEDAARS